MVDNKNEADVDELITVANKFYDEAQAAAIGVLESAWKSGEALVKIKATMKHGEWLPWIEANFHGDASTATRYMQLANHASLHDLTKYDSINAALKAISAKKAKDKPAPKSRPEPKPAPKADAPILADAINTLEDRGVKYTARDVVEIVATEGVEVSVDTVERKRKAVRAERNAPPVDYDSLTGTVKEKWDRVEATLRRKLEREYNTRLLAEVDQIKAQLKDDVKAYKEQLDAEAEAGRAKRDASREKYDIAVAAYKAKGLIPLDDYNLIRSCLHPDSRASVTDEKLASAFRVFNNPKIKALLVKE